MIPNILSNTVWTIQQRLRMPSNRRRNSLIASVMALPMALSLSVSVCAVEPIANTDDRVTLQGVDITINALANDTDADGDTLEITTLSAAANGTVSLNPDNSIFYVANNGFEGLETITYTVLDSNGESSTGTINILVNPALLSAEAKTSNNQQVGNAIDFFCFGLQPGSTESTAGQQLLASRCRGLYDLLQSGDELGVEEALTQIAGEEVAAQFDTSTELAKSHIKLVADRLLEIRQANSATPISLTLNNQRLDPFEVFGFDAVGGNAGDGSHGYDEPSLDPFSKWSLFFNGAVSQMSKENTDNEHGFDSDGFNLAFGGDYRFRNHLIGGVALGYKEETVEFSGDGGGLETEALSYTFYGSYFKNRWTIDMMLGLGDIDFYSVRNTIYSDLAGDIRDSSISDTTGDQTIFSLTWRYDLNQKNRYGQMLVSPFINVEYVNTDTEAFTETSNGAWAIQYEGQSFETQQLSLGVYASQPLSFSKGVFSPQVRLAYYHGFDSDANQATGYFVNDVNQNAFVLNSNEVDTQYFQVGLGASMTLIGGFSLFGDYEKILHLDFTDIDRLSYGVRWELNQ